MDRPDLEVASAAQCARLAGVPASTVRWWAHAGRLHPWSTAGPRPIYVVADVLRLEAEQRQRRTTPSSWEPGTNFNR